MARFHTTRRLLLGARFYFSRFRAADFLAKLALRLPLGAALILLVAFVILGPVASMDQTGTAHHAASILVGAGIVGCTIFFYARVGQWTDILVERGIFGERPILPVPSELCLVPRNPRLFAMLPKRIGSPASLSLVV